MNKSATQFCPVPQEQQPIQEYQDLQESWFYSWGSLELKSYIKKLSWIGFASSMIAAPIAGVSFFPLDYPFKFCVASSYGIAFLTSLVLFQLYVGWSHVRERLFQEKISYEESGWYDGQVWAKPESMLTRDRLIANYEIQPIIIRLRKTFLFILGTVAVGSIIWFV